MIIRQKESFRLNYYISRIDRSGILSLPNANSYDKETLSATLEVYFSTRLGQINELMQNHYSMMLPELKEPLNSLVVFPPTVFVPIEVKNNR